TTATRLGSSFASGLEEADSDSDPDPEMEAVIVAGVGDVEPDGHESFQGSIAENEMAATNSPAAARRAVTPETAPRAETGSRMARRRSSKWCGRAIASAGATGCEGECSERKMPSRWPA